MVPFGSDGSETAERRHPSSAGSVVPWPQLPRTPAASCVTRIGEAMSVVTAGSGASSATAAVGTEPRVGAGLTGLVLAGELDPADAVGLLGALAHAPRRGPALLSVDLERRTFVVAPHATAGETRLAISGELDPDTSPLLSGALAFAFALRAARVTLDLRRLRAIDAGNAGTIAGAAERVGGWGGTLAARGPRPAVRRALAANGLDDLLVPLGADR